MSAPASMISSTNFAGFDDHHVNVDRQVGHLADRLDDRHAVGDVRDEVAVHHVEVEGSGPGRFDRSHLRREVAEVAQQQRRQHHRRWVAKFIKNVAARHIGGRSAARHGRRSW